MWFKVSNCKYACGWFAAILLLVSSYSLLLICVPVLVPYYVEHKQCMPLGIYVSKNRYFHQMWQAKEALDKEIAREDSIFCVQ
jgi:hypothetical protein